jgi:hypothetical protein
MQPSPKVYSELFFPMQLAVFNPAVPAMEYQHQLRRESSTLQGPIGYLPLREGLRVSCLAKFIMRFHGPEATKLGCSPAQKMKLLASHLPHTFPHNQSLPTSLSVLSTDDQQKLFDPQGRSLPRFPVHQPTRWLRIQVGQQSIRASQSLVVGAAHTLLFS